MGAGLVGGRIGRTHLALFWVFSNFLLGVTALFSVILSARGLWSRVEVAASAPRFRSRTEEAEGLGIPCRHRCARMGALALSLCDRSRGQSGRASLLR